MCVTDKFEASPVNDIMISYHNDESNDVDYKSYRQFATHRCGAGNNVTDDWKSDILSVIHTPVHII